MISLKNHLSRAIILSLSLFISGSLFLNSSSNLTAFEQPSAIIYKDYLTFLFIMTLVDTAIRVIHHVIAKRKPKKQEISLGGLFGTKNQFGNEIWRTLFFVIVSYTLVFFIYQALGPFASLISEGMRLHYSSLDIRTPQTLSERMNHKQEDSLHNMRILEEEISDMKTTSLGSEPYAKAETISLAMGTVKSSLQLPVINMVLSRDQHIAFVISPSGLTIVHFSDSKSPRIISTLTLGLPEDADCDESKVLALSSDEKTLFVADPKNLEIIDITNLKSPQLISFTSSKAFSCVRAPVYFRASVAIDEISKTLYIGGLGLQVYNISNLQEPILLTVYQPDWTKAPLQINEISLSQDRRILFMANGTLDIYDVSNLRDIQLIHSLATQGSVESLYLKDAKNLLLVGKGSMLQEVDVSNYSSPVILSSYRLSGDIEIAKFLAISPGQTKYFIFIWDQSYKVLMFNSVKKTVTIDPKKFSPDGTLRTLSFSRDGKNLIAGYDSELKVVQLILDYPNHEVFDFSTNIIGNLSESPFQQIEISPDGKTMFGLTKRQSFEIWDVEDVRTPLRLSLMNFSEIFMQMHFPSHYKTAYLVHKEGISVLNASNRSAPSLIKDYQANNQSPSFLKIAPLSNEKTVIAITGDPEAKTGSVVSIYNLSETTSSADRIFSLKKPCKLENCGIVLQDDRTLFVIDRNLTIYDISNFESPVEIASLPLTLKETRLKINSYRLSSDKKTLYIEIHDWDLDRSNLRFYSVSNASSPFLIAEQSFSTGGTPFFLTPDLKIGFYHEWISQYLVRMDFSDLKRPRMIGTISLPPYEPDLDPFIVSPDGQTVYIAEKDEKTEILNANVNYTVYLNQEKFLLGQKYSNSVALLGLVNPFDYEPLDNYDFKIIKLSLQDIKVHNRGNIEFSTSLLPSWIEFDRRKNLLTLEPHQQDHLGRYTFGSAFSRRIPLDAFKNIGPLKEDESIDDLLPWLISLGYVDTDLFLTENFEKIDFHFFLPAPFRPFKGEIWSILKTFYVETCTTFEIVPSLELQYSNGLVVSTLSPSQVKVDIQLTSHAQFLSKHYGSLLPRITHRSSRLSLEGTLKEVNEALQSIVVNFENGTYCDAYFEVEDRLNKKFEVNLTNASKYFIPNQPPTLNSKTSRTLQQQIDAANAETGRYFTVTLDQDTFQDEFSETLTYEIDTPRNNTAVPSWLTLNGLKLRGTPPEELEGREIDLVIVAKNEFRQLRQPFKLHVNISLAFFFKLALKYGSYLLTVVGIYIGFNKIVNILAKKSYKHPKEYIISSGEEITPRTIFPIFFIRREKEESNLILKHLEKFISKTQQTKSVDRPTFVNFFVDSSSKELDKQKVINTIQRIVAYLPIKEKKKLSLYCSAKNSKKAVIQQLVIDQIVLWQLDQEKPTKSLFQSIKDKWIDDMVYWDDSIEKFALNQTKFEELSLPARSHKSSNLSLSEESLLTQQELLSSEINISLLRDSVLAYAFGAHQINRSPIQVEVHMKEKVAKNPLFRFLKLDLESINIGDKSRMDYGINYKVTNDVLNFSGVTDINLPGKTLVIQITTTRKRILKEIWIHGDPETLENQETIYDPNENHYEIY